MPRIRVLVVEDSLTVRKRLVEVIASDPALEVIAEGENGKQAIELCQALRPDVITLDMHLPILDGVSATEHIMGHFPTPILIVSSSTNRGDLFKTYDALAAGAVDVLEKPSAQEVDGAWERKFLAAIKLVSRIRVITHIRARLGSVGRAAPARADIPLAPSRGIESGHAVIALGASTGGPGALVDVLRQIPVGLAAAMLVVLHIDEPFSSAFAEWLANQTSHSVSYARGGELLGESRGRVFMAPPGRHLAVTAGKLWLSSAPERHSCRPSVDVLFESLAAECPRDVAACLLTGMGRDGADGLLALRRAGAHTIAQDEATSVIYGMPREAALLGAAERILPLSEIGAALTRAATKGDLGVAASILVVDDSLTVRMDLSEAFEAAGFSTLLASTVAEARKLLARQPVSAVILDVILPDEDGIELLREIRAAQSADAPFVLLLSSEADVRDRIRGISVGADDYVGKPYDTSYVIARVRELLRAKRPIDAPAKQTILIVDDSPTFRAELGAALEAAQYAVVTAADGDEGLKIADNIRPTAILVDSVMPGIDGGTMIRRIRLDAALRATPCVLLTASDDRGAELRALEAGADAFVRKEDLELVLARVSAVLRATSLEPVLAASLHGPKRVLAVDDSATYLHELLAVLRGEGYDVVPARSGEEGIEMLATQPFDCILLDLLMPGIDGIETCRRIKASPLHRDIPLIMLTAAENRKAMIEALGSGADDFISKSSELEVLKARVRAQLRRKQFEDEHRSVREKLLRSQIEAAEARAARELAETRAKLVEALEQKNQELTLAYSDLQTAQSQLVQSAKLASLGELVAGVAHEINNPLAFVISHLGTVRRSTSKVNESIRNSLAGDSLATWERALDRLSEMDVGLQRMRDLVLKLRTFSRLDEGERKVVSIRECVESLLTILGHRLKDRVEVETQYGEPDLIECYPGLLTQAIMNLVANAIDAITGHGKVTIRSGMQGELYRIGVADTGIGIPEAVKHKILDPFFTTKPVGQGTGLGLSITYSIVRKHGGTLEFHDLAGGGTEARILIPIAGDSH